MKPILKLCHFKQILKLFYLKQILKCMKTRFLTRKIIVLAKIICRNPLMILETTWYFTKKMSTVSGHPIMAHFLMVGAKGSVHHAGRNSIGPGPQANVCCALCHYLCIEKRIPSVWQIHPIPIMKREEKQRSTILRKRETKIIIMRHLDDFKRIFHGKSCTKSGFGKTDKKCVYLSQFSWPKINWTF